MSTLYENCRDWFVGAIKHSVAPNHYVEIANGKLEVKSTPLLLIEASDIDIEVHFCSQSSAYSILSSPNVSENAIKLSVTCDSNFCKIVISEDKTKLKNQKAKVLLNIQHGLTSLTIESGAGDIRLCGCDAKEAFISTTSGDILVNDHVSPCYAIAKSKYGDIVKNGFSSKSSINLLHCKTVNGDIVLSSKK